MDKNTLITLKSRYILFKDYDRAICVYDREEKNIILKANIKGGIDVDYVNSFLSVPNRVEYILTQSFKALAGKLIKNYSYIFNVVDEEKLKVYNNNRALVDVINPINFIEGTKLTNNFNSTRIILYGFSNECLLIAKYISENNYKEIIIVDDNSSVESYDIFNNKIYKFNQIGIKKYDLLKEYFNNNYNNIRVIAFSEIDKYMGKEDIHIINKGMYNMNDLLSINDKLVKNNQIGIFINISSENFIFGPLIIGNETSCLRCLIENNELKEFYSEKKFNVMTNVYVHLAMFFINKTIYTIKENNLKYLLGDVQLPINKVIVINKENMNGIVKSNYKNISCKCS